MQVIIFGDLITFPLYDAPASTNRVISYARGLIDNGQKCYVLTFSNIYHKPIGKYEKIPFYIPLKQQKRNRNFLIRNVKKLIKYYNTFCFFWKLKKTKKKMVLLVYSRTPIVILYAFLISKIFKTKFIYELNELPFKDAKSHFEKWVFQHILFKTFDGFICISSYLENYSRKFSKKLAKTIIIPILTLPEKQLISVQSTRETSVKYILYSGTLSFHRDGIDDLIEAFSVVSRQFPDLYLVLGGKWVDDLTQRGAIQLIENLNIVSKVVFKGLQSFEDYSKTVQNATLCCIPRKKTEETIAAFPTKLVDYLQESKPVIITSVGDISLYCTDGLNLFLVEPEDSNCLAQKMIEVLRNYKMAEVVAVNGNKLADDVFSYRENGILLIKFLVKI